MKEIESENQTGRAGESTFPRQQNFFNCFVVYLQFWQLNWNRFWFTPRSPQTLGLIRFFTGCIVLYSHSVWTLEFDTFFSDHGLLPTEYRQLYFGSNAWSHFDWISSPTLLWSIHWLGFFCIALFALGIGGRITAIVTTALLISYTNRATGALFGLDQLMVLLCLYLSIGNSSGAFSLRSWWHRRKILTGQNGAETPDLRNRAGQGSQALAVSDNPSGDIPTNIAIRLIQLHLCLIYFFAGLGKLQGETWWNGQAIWFSVASYEYQTWDLTWLANHMELVALITLVTVYWEVSYPALIWFRLTRPIMLAIAVLTHLGIGLVMGMMTFGLIMLVANLSFVELGRKTSQVQPTVNQFETS